jgi:hypothetical protein
MLYTSKFAIITPYYKEPRATLQRAIDSVKSLQDCGLEVVHYLVSDGHPQDIEDNTLVHIKLPKAHADYGDTPRIVGAALAIRDGCYGLMFLDADNMLYPEHLKLAYQAHQQHQTDLVLARRRMLREDGTPIDYEEDKYQSITHVDTGCYVFFGEKVYDVLEWAKIPSALSVVGDRYFWKMLSGKSTGNLGIITQPTIGYTCLWKDVYLNAGETPPDNAKLLNFEVHDQFCKNLTDTEKVRINQRLFQHD